MTGYLSCPTRVRCADLGAAVALLDTRDGRVHTLLGAARELWLTLAADPAAPLPASTADLAGRLREAGVLEVTATPRPWRILGTPKTRASWGSQEVPAALAATGRIPVTWVLPAAIGLGTVLLARSAGPGRRAFHRVTTLVHWAARLGRRRASRETCRRAIDCVRALGRLSPFRTACLEETAAAMLALALVGRRAGWCHGIAADPIRLHAWLALDGQPVSEPASTTRYVPLIQIPEPGLGQRR